MLERFIDLPTNQTPLVNLELQEKLKEILPTDDTRVLLELSELLQAIILKDINLHRVAPGSLLHLASLLKMTLAQRLESYPVRPFNGPADVILNDYGITLMVLGYLPIPDPEFFEQRFSLSPFCSHYGALVLGDDLVTMKDIPLDDIHRSTGVNVNLIASKNGYLALKEKLISANILTTDFKFLVFTRLLSDVGLEALRLKLVTMDDILADLSEPGNQYCDLLTPEGLIILKEKLFGNTKTMDPDVLHSLTYNEYGVYALKHGLITRERAEAFHINVKDTMFASQNLACLMSKPGIFALSNQLVTLDEAEKISNLFYYLIDLYILITHQHPYTNESLSFKSEVAIAHYNAYKGNCIPFPDDVEKEMKYLESLRGLKRYSIFDAKEQPKVSSISNVEMKAPGFNY